MPERRTDVLLFGTMGKIGRSVSDSLVSHGLKVVLEEFGQNVFRDEPGYRRNLVRAMVRHRPGTVFPIGNPLAMARFKGLIGKGAPLEEILHSHRTDPLWEEAVRGTRIIVESEETIRLLDSQVSFFRFAGGLGIKQPELYATEEDIPEGVQIVFKRDISFGGHGVHLPKSRKALKNLIAHQSPGEPFLIQRYIEGEDYSLDAVRSDGRLFTGGYKCIASKGSGPSELREILDGDNPVLAQMREYAGIVLERLDYHGVCGFDFRADREGQLYLLECNPRFTGGIASQTEAGFNIPWTAYQSASSAEF